MKTEEIPQEEASKLRLIRELPFILQVPIDRIIRIAANWPEALAKIDHVLTKIIDGVETIKSIRDMFKFKGPVGEQRKEKR